LVRAALGLDQRAGDGGSARCEHAIAGRDDRARGGVDLARTAPQPAREEVTERRIAAERELYFVEVGADRARKCAIRQPAKPRWQRPRGSPTDQRRVGGTDARTRAFRCNASWLAEIHAGARPLMTAWLNAVRNTLILPGGPPSYKRRRGGLAERRRG